MSEIIHYPCGRCGEDNVTVEGNTCASCLVPGEYEAFQAEIARMVGVAPGELPSTHVRRHTSN